MRNSTFKDIPNANIYSFSDRKGKFVLIDDAKALEILDRLGEHALVQEIMSKYDVANFGTFQNPAWTDPLLAKNTNNTNTNTNIRESTSETTTEHLHSCCSHEHHHKPKK